MTIARVPVRLAASMRLWAIGYEQLSYRGWSAKKDVAKYCICTALTTTIKSHQAIEVLCVVT